MVNNLRLMLVMFLWAICFPLITLGINYSPHLTFAAIRALLSGVMLLAIAMFLGCRMPKTTKDWLMLAFIGFGATSLGFYGMFHAAEFVAPGMATVIASTQPLMAAILAHWFINERLNHYGKIGLVLGFTGIVLITAPQLSMGSGEAFRIGTEYIIISAIGITISNLLIKRLSNEIDPLVSMGWQLVMGSIPLAVIAFTTEAPLTVQWTGEFIVSLMGLSLAGTALAYWLWCRLLITVDLSHANAFTFLVPVFGLAMGVGFYGEQISFIMMGGIIVTLFGIFLVAKGTGKKIETS